jgi:hypothetical protein
MSAMLLYVEDLRSKLAALDKDHEPPRIIPSCLAMGWIRNMIDSGNALNSSTAGAWFRYTLMAANQPVYTDT